jgi:hypothetical protein
MTPTSVSVSFLPTPGHSDYAVKVSKKNAQGEFVEEQSIPVSDGRRLNGSRRLATAFSCPSKSSSGVITVQVESLEANSEFRINVEVANVQSRPKDFTTPTVTAPKAPTIE